MAVLGAVAMVYGLLAHFVVLVPLGGAALALAGSAFILHRRHGDEPSRTHARRADKARAEIASWSAVLPLAVILAALAFQPAPRTDLVSGKPVEVRSGARLVVMPDGRSFTFFCGSSQHQRLDCPALAKWRALPRWPEPERVEMEVLGSQIVGLRMDGQVIVDRTVDNSDKGDRVLMGLAGGALAVAAIWAIHRRARLLIVLRNRSESLAAPRAS